MSAASTTWRAFALEDTSAHGTPASAQARRNRSEPGYTSTPCSARVASTMSFLAAATPSTVSAPGRIAGRALGQRDAARGEEVAHAVLAQLAVDVALVVAGQLEGTGVGALEPSQQVVEGPLPGGGVDAGAVGEDAVHVE